MNNPIDLIYRIVMCRRLGCLKTSALIDSDIDNYGTFFHAL